MDDMRRADSRSYAGGGMQIPIWPFFTTPA